MHRRSFPFNIVEEHDNDQQSRIFHIGTVSVPTSLSGKLAALLHYEVAGSCDLTRIGTLPIHLRHLVLTRTLADDKAVRDSEMQEDVACHVELPCATFD